MSSYEDRHLAELSARIVEIDLAIAELNIEYDNTAVRFNGGNPEILKQAASIEEKIQWLRKERNLAENATKQATDAVKRAEEEREREDHRSRCAQARELASAIITIGHELDDAMSALTQIFQRKHALLRDLQITGVANTVATKLMSRGVNTRAACFAGIDAHLDLTRCAPGSRLPFTSADPLLHGIGRELSAPTDANALADCVTNGGGRVEGET
jgi:hypothetical protein